MKLINKDALVAEIESRIKSIEECFNGKFPISQSVKETEQDKGKLVAYKSILSFLDTLEVKGVDLCKEEERIWKDFNMGECYLSKNDLENIAKHFFELGLKAKDWEKKRMKECPYRQVVCTMYEGKVLECKGDCSWVVDYPKLKELKAQKGE